MTSKTKYKTISQYLKQIHWLEHINCQKLTKFTIKQQNRPGRILNRTKNITVQYAKSKYTKSQKLQD